MVGHDYPSVKVVAPASVKEKVLGNERSNPRIGEIQRSMPFAKIAVHQVVRLFLGGRFLGSSPQRINDLAGQLELAGEAISKIGNHLSR